MTAMINLLLKIMNRTRKFYDKDELIGVVIALRNRGLSNSEILDLIKEIYF